MPIYSGLDAVALTEATRNILIWGPPITGKTFSLWTLARWLKEKDLGKLHVCDLDRKIESLVLKLQKEGLLDMIEIMQTSPKDTVQLGAQNVAASKDEFLEIQKWINSFYDHMDPRTGKWKDGVKIGAIFIDSLTRFQVIVKEYTVAILGRDIGSPGTDGRADYGKIMAKTDEVIQSLKALPCITGWIAHETIERDDLIGKIVALPNMIGRKPPGEIAKEFNAVLHSRAKIDGGKATYEWQVVPGEWVVSAGVTSRVDGLPPFIPQDFGGIF